MQSVCVEATTIACTISQAGLQQYRTWQTATHELYKIDVLRVLCRGPRISSLHLAWCFPKFRTRRLLSCIGVSQVQHHCPHHQLGEVTVPPRRGIVGVGHASRSCVWCGGAVGLRAAVILLCFGLWRVASGKPSIGWTPPSWFWFSWK